MGKMTVFYANKNKSGRACMVSRLFEKAAAILTLALLLLCLLSCASAENKKASLPDLKGKTLGYLMSLEIENAFYVLTPHECVYNFTYNGVPYKARAAFTGDFDNQPDVFEDGYEEKMKEIISPLIVSDVEDFSSLLLPQAELDSYKGKKCDALLKAGFEYTGHFASEEGVCYYMNKGGIDYIVECEEKISDFDLDIEAILPTFTIKNIKVEGVSM